MAALATALLDGEQAKPGGLLEGVLNHPATDSGSGRDLVHAPVTVPVLADLVPDDPQHCQLADRKLAGEARRHRTGRGEVATPGNRNRALGSPLRPPGQEDRRPAGWDAHRLD